MQLKSVNNPRREGVAKRGRWMSLNLEQSMYLLNLIEVSESSFDFGGTACCTVGSQLRLYLWHEAIRR